MKIDKTRFLLLTTTIATAAAAAIVVSSTGCNTTTTETDAGGTSSSGGSSSGSSGNTDGSTTGDGSTTSDSGGDGSTAACLGNTGAAPVCTPAEDDAGVDAGGSALCPFECDNLNANFKTEVAKNINDCLNLAPTCEGIAACVPPALAKACDDPSAATYCTTLLATCSDAGPNPSQNDCVGVVKAMSDQGRTALTSCVVEGGCGFCFDSLKAGGGI